MARVIDIGVIELEPVILEPCEGGCQRSVKLTRLGRVCGVETVYAYSDGVRVRTTARARQQGSLGELVEVESLGSFRRYKARVTSSLTVKVVANSDSVSTQPATQQGVARPAVDSTEMTLEDVLPDNTVLSEDIAELMIRRVQTGSVRDGTRRGWLTRLIDKYAPF